MTLLLETRNVSKSYGAFRALEQVNVAVHQGEVVSVVGPNGAGKTTLVNLLTGLLEPSSGEVLFMGENIAGVGPVELADHGLARAFQLIQIFPKLTVKETIAAAVVSRQKKRWRLFSRLAADSEVGGRVREVAEIFGLEGTPARIEVDRACEAVVAGKPYEPAADLIRKHLGPVAVMVGDRPETDGALGVRIGGIVALVTAALAAGAGQLGAAFVVLAAGTALVAGLCAARRRGGRR